MTAGIGGYIPSPERIAKTHAQFVKTKSKQQDSYRPLQSASEALKLKMIYFRFTDKKYFNLIKKLV